MLQRRNDIQLNGEEACSVPAVAGTEQRIFSSNMEVLK
jgi:hypothetical protein